MQARGACGSVGGVLFMYVTAMPTPKAVAPSIPYDRIRAVEWLDGRIRLIDQRLLPGRLEHLTLQTLNEAVQAIRDMAVRGAPAIGITAAYAVVLAARARFAENPANWQAALEPDLHRLAEALRRGSLSCDPARLMHRRFFSPR